MELKRSLHREIKGRTAQIANFVIATIAFNLKYLIWVRKHELEDQEYQWKEDALMAKIDRVDEFC